MRKFENIFWKIMKKLFFREFITYGIFGVMTTLVNILVFQLLWKEMGIIYGIANIIAVLAAKVFAYLTNKCFVFRSHCANIRELLMEIIRYIFARGFTGLIDIFGMLFAVEILMADEMIAKYIIQVIVIVLNYIFGKRLVFRENEKNRERTATA